MSLIPRPPTSTGQHTLLHFTQAIFISFDPQSQRNFAWIFLIWLQTALGALKNENKTVAKQ